jgi:hypothetical protein
MIERIEVSAIRYPWGEVVTGYRHSDIIKFMASKRISSARVSQDEQGFLGTSGRFYTRIGAKSVALAAGQIELSHKGVLYSEDLWPEPPQLT